MSKYAFKEYINDLWISSKLSQGQFAKKLNIGLSTLKDSLRGITSIPNPTYLKSLSKYTKQSELKVLQNVFFYNFKDDIKQNPDTNSLTLYACYLYKKDWSIFNATLHEQTKPHYDRSLKGTVYEENEYNITLKKSHYPKRAMYLQEGIHETIDKDFAFYIWRYMENILEDNGYHNSKFTSYDCAFVYDNNKKNKDLLTKIKQTNLVKPKECNSIKFVILDNKTEKIIEEYTF